MFGLSHVAVKKIIDVTKRNISESYKDFKPLLYNIRNTQKGNNTDHYGSFHVLMVNLSG
jgi:protein-arginine kinase activator protein McsA